MAQSSNQCSICCLQGIMVLFNIRSVTGTNLILTVQVSYLERWLQDVTLGYTSLLQ